MFEVGPRQLWSIARVELVGVSRRFPVILEYLAEAALDIAVKCPKWNPGRDLGTAD